MLRVDFTFDKKIIEKNGYTMSNIYETIKMEFGKKNISCVAAPHVAVDQSSPDPDRGALKFHAFVQGSFPRRVFCHSSLMKNRKSLKFHT